MKPGDLAKVKDSCSCVDERYMQQIYGRECLVLSFPRLVHNPFSEPTRCLILIFGKQYLVWTRDLEKINEAR